GERLRRDERVGSQFGKPVGEIAQSLPGSSRRYGDDPLQSRPAEKAPRGEGCRQAGRPVPASFFPGTRAPDDARAQTCPPTGSLSTVSKNVTSSAEVRTARRPIPSAPHASMTARRVSRQPPGWPREPRPRPPSHSAESRSTQRNSPLPRRAPRSRERSERSPRPEGRRPARPASPAGSRPGAAQFSLRTPQTPTGTLGTPQTPVASGPPDRAPGSEDRPGEGQRQGSGNLSSGSGHAVACSGSWRAAVTLAASCASRKPQRSPTDANGLRPRPRSRGIS